jgi:hypothetical protein
LESLPGYATTQELRDVARFLERKEKTSHPFEA